MGAGTRAAVRARQNRTCGIPAYCSLPRAFDEQAPLWSGMTLGAFHMLPIVGAVNEFGLFLGPPWNGFERRLLHGARGIAGSHHRCVRVIDGARAAV
jgi:hypothetical protein